MSGYEILKFVHVLAVIAWVGGAIAIYVLQARLGAAGDRQGLMALGRQMEDMGKLYYSPMAAVTLVTGIWMVATTEGLSFEEAWVVIGFAGIVITLAVGLGVVAPTGKKLLAESQSPQPDGAAIASYASRIRVLSLVNIAVLVVVVWSMVARPGA